MWGNFDRENEKLMKFAQISCIFPVSGIICTENSAEILKEV